MGIFAPPGVWFVLFTTVVPYGLGGYLLAGLIALALRRRAEPAVRRWYAGAIVFAVLGSVLHAVLLAPAYLGAHAHGRPDLVVMTLNLRKGHADPAFALGLARTHQVQVLVLEELTHAERARLSGAGLDDLFPYHAGRPAPGTPGTVVFSRYPVADAAPIAVANGGIQARILAPRPFWVVGIHPSQPLSEPQTWSQDWDGVDRAARALTSAGPDPVIVAGDFNATLDHGPVRELLAHGFTDAARRANAGWQATYPDQPAGFGWLPWGLGRVTIDHILFNDGFDAISTFTSSVPGTDHRALIAELRREPAATQRQK